MAKGTAICICETCGKEFEVEKICYNRRDADQWAEWAAEHYCECTSCYRKRMDEEAKKEAEAMNLPEIVAVSEKQKKYAEDIRAKYIRRSKTEIKYVQNMLKCLDPAEAQKIANTKGKTVVEMLTSVFERRGVLSAYIMLTSADARQIIDSAR